VVGCGNTAGSDGMAKMVLAIFFLQRATLLFGEPGHKIKFSCKNPNEDRQV
jgi:hypothetical protein